MRTAKKTGWQHDWYFTSKTDGMGVKNVKFPYEWNRASMVKNAVETWTNFSTCCVQTQLTEHQENQFFSEHLFFHKCTRASLRNWSMLCDWRKEPNNILDHSNYTRRAYIFRKCNFMKMILFFCVILLFFFCSAELWLSCVNVFIWFHFRYLIYKIYFMWNRQSVL